MVLVAIEPIAAGAEIRVATSLTPGELALFDYPQVRARAERHTRDTRAHDARTHTSARMRKPTALAEVADAQDLLFADGGAEAAPMDTSA